MPCIKDKTTVEAIAREYCSNGRNKLQALKTIGYKDSYCNTRGIGVVYSNERVIDAIARIDAKNSVQQEHNRQIAIDKLTSDYDNLEDLALKGNIQAIQARTAIIRELNAISNLHSSILVTDDKQAQQLTDAQAQAAKRLAPYLLLNNTG